ncbi:MAG: nitroreductase family deazaflavin-dependent oxidoreductase [Candidatus Promineifilaceae bacterium]
MSDWNKQVIEEFRANDGQVGGYFAGRTLLLLHTTGAKSGLERVNPVATIENGDKLVIIASKGGAPSSPDWYYNLVTNPVVGVEYGTDEFQARATVTTEPERTELFDKMASEFGGFSEYKEKTTRVIPVVTLSRLS